MPPKKVVLQLSLREEKTRKKAFVTVCRASGVNSVAVDDKTEKMTVVGEVDVSVIVMKLRKICNADIVSVEDVKPPEKKPEPAKSDPPKPAVAKAAEVPAFPVPLNYQFQYNPGYAYSHYQPYGHSRVVVDEPNTCVVM